MKVIITESQYNRAIDYYISYCLESHEVKISKDYPNSIFWVKDGNIIVEIKNSKYFWLHVDIWDSISRMFELDYNGTQSVIKEWLEQHHNLGGLTPESDPFYKKYMLEQHHNLGGLTPRRAGRFRYHQLEQHHNLGD